MKKFCISQISVVTVSGGMGTQQQQQQQQGL